MVMTTSYYSTVIENIYEDAERGRKKLIRWFHLIPYHIFIKYTLRQFKTSFLSHSLKIKGLLATYHQRDIELPNQSIENIILDLNKLTKVFIKAKEQIPPFSEQFEQNYPDILIIKTSIDNSIDDLYDLLRLLKKAHKKEGIVTTELAIGASIVSQQTLEKVINAH